MRPPAFRTLTLLASLNTASVGASLAASTAAAFRMMGDFSDARTLTTTSLSTFVLGMVWARQLRARRTVGSTSIRRGWLLSLPIAMANAMLAGGLAMTSVSDAHPAKQFVGGAVLGATLGAIYWLPGLFCTLLFFGVPLASAQHMASSGLSGEERGERVVGIASTLMAALAFVISLDSPTSRSAGPITGLIVQVFALAGALPGLAAAWLAHRRMGDRRAFVRSVEAGEQPRFRLEDSPRGKVLVRIVRSGAGYRVPEEWEALATLDYAGEVSGFVERE